MSRKRRKKTKMMIRSCTIKKLSIIRLFKTVRYVIAWRIKIKVKLKIT